MAEGIYSSLSVAAQWCGGRLEGEDGLFRGVSTDSRTLQPRNLFVALRGVRFDGHDHVIEVADRGASAAVVDRPLQVNLPQILVDDTRKALGRLAAEWRGRMSTPLIAITGSNGKTTVKEMTAAILRKDTSPVLVTEGNLNNDIGLPLTLFRLSPEHCWGVLELGANHPGEIAYLTAIARPRVAVVTNAGPAHLAGFGTVDGVAQAKGEIFSGLDDDGIAVINADSPYASLWKGLAAGRQVVTFGVQEPSDVTAERDTDQAGGNTLRLRIGREVVSVRLPLRGRHNVMNALAAAAACSALGIHAAQIRDGLESVAPVNGRLRFLAGKNGAQLIDDTYNANPASLKAAFEVLAECEGRRIVALGDMAELGAAAEQLHEQTGLAAREMGIDRFYAVGALSCSAARSFGAGGACFEDAASMSAALREELAPGVTVLIKGSRSVRMERVLDELVAGEGV